MSEDISNKITENQYMGIVQGSMIAMGILTLARGVSKYAYQQGWIPVIIAGMYPIFVVLLATFIDKKMKHCDFWEINNKIYGKFLSYMITIIFFIVFVFLQLSIVSGFVNIIHLVLVPFIKPYIIVIITTLLTLYTAINGLTLVARLSEIVFYLVIISIGITLSFISQGTITNVMPFFSSFKDTLLGIPDSLYSYAGIELSYIVISFISNKKNIKKSGVYAVLTIILLYTINVFVTIYCIGWEMTSKSAYPILYIAATLEVPLLENVRTVIMILWSYVIFRILACDLFASAYCLSKVLGKGYKNSCIIITILVGILSFFMLPEYNRAKFIGELTIYIVAVGLGWGIITSIIILFKTKNSKDT